MTKTTPNIQSKTMQIGAAAGQFSDAPVKGEYVKIGEEDFYKISNYDQMPPFFMSIVSSSDHWLFISSKGGLTAGRRNPETALFPYYTDDKIHDAHDTTGSKTVVRASNGGVEYLWEPFSDRYEGIYAISRNIYKNVAGNKLIFEEVNDSIGLQFKYGWFNSDKYGIVRKAWIKNISDRGIEVDLLDGIQNLLPYGVPQTMQANFSTLVDAYKKNELEAETGLGLYLLSSIIVDKAEPSEALTCNTVWSYGLEGAKRLVSSKQLHDFRRGISPQEEIDIRAERGAYFLNKKINLASDTEEVWYMVAEVKQSASDVASLLAKLRNKEGLAEKLEQDIVAGTKKLTRLVGCADGLQLSADRDMTARHYSNVLFNIMRGGVFVNNYQVQKTDFDKFVHHSNKTVAANESGFFENLPDSFNYLQLLKQAEKSGNPNLLRLSYEYLPLIFSRRHGDPSRPWNKFTIDVKSEDGSDNLYYAGNWRDIFQNWEALAYSYPGFIESMIAKFVNASTPDGYNPYRITRDGIDWEVVEPDDPWSYIGYWGDHQIIYLQKLMEVSHCHCPDRLEEMLSQPIFAYANVPYRIKTYQEQLDDPFDTVVFDNELEKEIGKRVAEIGADGKLLFNRNGSVRIVNLTEKLLVSVLAKFSNFIPEGGIWLNTQRPEWNDANNALVGNGVSMVTLYYMCRFQSFCKDLFANSKIELFQVSEEVVDLFESVFSTFQKYQHLLSKNISDKDRKKILDLLGNAGSTYRFRIYKDGFSEKTAEINRSDLLNFFELSLKYIHHSIKANRRPDGLYHAYNLMSIKNTEEISIRYLYEMLEGQVAVLSSGYLSAEESLNVLNALRQSTMYRKDQNSYILYPDRSLPRFLEKNNIPDEFANKSELFVRLISDGNEQLVEKDVFGKYHFNGLIRNANDIRDVLNDLNIKGYAALIKKEENGILNIFEKMFDHQSFTGRSGTFFGYEGLGSIYWHMVSKLLLAAEETCLNAGKNNADEKIINQLAACYYDIRDGIGFNKTPEEYGAFPTDPYSHTPNHAGAQQPGMTGQVKEDILARFAELGVFVERGNIVFRPTLLKEDEFLKTPKVFNYFNLKGEGVKISVPANSLAFTYCQVPIIYHRTEKSEVVVTKKEAVKITSENMFLNLTDSESIFERKGEIERIDVFFNLSKKLNNFQIG